MTLENQIRVNAHYNTEYWDHGLEEAHQPNLASMVEESGERLVQLIDLAGRIERFEVVVEAYSPISGVVGQLSDQCDTYRPVL